jgi:hypothetical protein
MTTSAMLQKTVASCSLRPKEQNTGNGFSTLRGQSRARLHKNGSKVAIVETAPKAHTTSIAADFGGELQEKSQAA